MTDALEPLASPFPFHKFGGISTLEENKKKMRRMERRVGRVCYCVILEVRCSDYSTSGTTLIIILTPFENLLIKQNYFTWNSDLSWLG